METMQINKTNRAYSTRKISHSTIASAKADRMEQIKDVINEGLNLITPSWPLQSSVAVNPFWFHKSKNFVNTLFELEPILHQSLLMPLEYYKDKYRSGEISHKALQSAIDHTNRKWHQHYSSIEQIEDFSQASQPPSRGILSFAEFVEAPLNYHEIAINEVSKFCAGYFDEHQSIISYPWQNESFWIGWFDAQRFDKSMYKFGIKQFRTVVDSFIGLNPEDVIREILQDIQLDEVNCQKLYMQRLIVSISGWASQFRYVEWQQSLGKKVAQKVSLLELIAVRMIYDYAIYREFLHEQDPSCERWRSKFLTLKFRSTEQHKVHVTKYIWQLAQEKTYQQWVSKNLQESAVQNEHKAKYKMVFCIDVRSELIRRKIEEVNKDIQTMGFAGFFGLAISYQKADEKDSSHRCPVLLAPQYQVHAASKMTASKQADHSSRIWKQLVYSYFRNMRKASFSSFLFVELFGILTLINIISNTFKSIVLRKNRTKLPPRFNDSHLQNRSLKISHLHGSITAVNEKVDKAESILKNLGLQSDFGELVIFCGHGAATTNNAMASTLDCGACGGHSGDINARVVSKLLNDSSVRTGLRQRGLNIPESTWFIAALHETVTDTIFILDEEDLPTRYKHEVALIKKDLQEATKKAIIERNYLLSDSLDKNAKRRSLNWAEVRPEWGLAGNACFIVAPRAKTKNTNFSGRSFLHDYNWKHDKDFKTLELIMTAPMVVTNWINLQYYGSVVAPDYYGSGNKVLHNLTNESGVIEGNGGDLRIGLSFQSIHDGSDYTHAPLRLSVFIEAPRQAIESIIKNNQVVKDLIDNEWVHLLHIDPVSGKVSNRISGGKYQELVSD
ncbi:MAG: putative inorganic carbon transporter subunit DabA [Oligoflexus sp.]